MELRMSLEYSGLVFITLGGNMKLFMIFLAIILMVVALSWFVYYQDNHLVVSDYTYTNSNIPPEFNNYKIMHLSDLHDKEFGDNQETLLSYIQDVQPDAIFLTGDFVTKQSIAHSKELVEALSAKYEIFFVPGNHEAGYTEYDEWKQILTDNNVHILENEAATITKDNASINVVGLLDPAFYKQNEEADVKDLNNTLQVLTEDLKGATLLLAHRPEYIVIYSKYNINLVFSGHAHGGQFILPFVGSVYAPGQGLFPKLTQGKHEKDGTTLIISRGLGNLAPVPRLFNYPEIVVVTLHNT